MNDIEKTIKRGLIIRRPYIDMILSGKKTWEMRSTHTKVRGRIALIEAGYGMIVGEADLVDSLEFDFKDSVTCWEHQSKHGLTFEDFPKLDKWSHAWVLENVIKYKRPIPYNHPQGAVIWVKLNQE